MTRGRLDKKIPVLEPFFESILVCNDKNLRPFIEIFVHEPENLTQQRLGTLLGIFEVADDTEDSSYIVNYLISVIKKEYFSKPKNGSVESFEAALHKANLALSKLAEHGSINWIGKLNALIAVIEKNSLHLSQAGSAPCFLLRSGMLTEISEGLSQEEAEPSPLKTFVNVSSGKIEAGDKLIVATENIFEIFSPDEIKKSAVRFSNEQFIQFLKTALVNELEKSAVLVADIKEKKEAPKPAAASEEPINAFSQAAFYKAKPKPEKTLPETESPKPAEKEAARHIYIRQGEESPEKPADPAAAMQKIGAGALSFLVFLKNNLLKFFLWLKHLAVLAFLKIKMAREKRQAQKAAELSSQPAAVSSISSQDREIIRQEIGAQSAGKNYAENFKNIFGKFSRSLWPKLSVIRSSFSRLTGKQKISAVTIILAIIFVPLLINKITARTEKKVEAPPAPIVEVVAPVPLENDTNIIRLDSVNQLFSGSAILKPVEVSGKMIAVSQSQVISLENNETFAVPEDFGQVDLACGMDDLNLVFLLNKAGRKITAWSPVSRKFQNNTVDIPADADITAMGTYLTYLYLVDAKNNQIYRYPRAEGGFGTRAAWKKDDTNISAAVDMALNENLFVADGNSILEFYRGKKQDFTVGTTATPIQADKLYTKKDNANLYVLDRENARVIKLDATGKILGQYYHPDIGQALGFTVNEPAGTVYVSSPDSVQSFQLQ